MNLSTINTTSAEGTPTLVSGKRFVPSRPVPNVP